MHGVDGRPWSRLKKSKDEINKVDCGHDKG